MKNADPDPRSLSHFIFFGGNVSYHPFFFTNSMYDIFTPDKVIQNPDPDSGV